MAQGDRIPGVDVLICANTGTDVAPVWTPIGGQSGAKLSRKADTKELKGHKLQATGHAKEYEYGDTSWDISCDGVLIKDEEAYAALVTAQEARTKVKVRVKEGTEFVREGLALVTGLDEDYPYEDDATYSLTLQGTGVLSEPTGV